MPMEMKDRYRQVSASMKHAKVSNRYEENVRGFENKPSAVCRWMECVDVNNDRHGGWKRMWVVRKRKRRRSCSNKEDVGRPINKKNIDRIDE